jgi:hypothetical protein
VSAGVPEAAVHTFDAPSDASLRVEIPAGTVDVRTWSTPRVEVEVAPARGDERSVEAATATRVSGAERGGRTEVVVRAPKREGWLGLGLGRAPELAVSIRCPESSDLELATNTADLEARGPLGAVSVRSASADATLDGTESLTFATASGDLSAGAVADALAAKSASGDVDVRSVGATASVSTVSGDVRIGATGGAAAVKTVSGDVRLEAAAGAVLVGSVSGDVEVAAVPGLVLWIDAQSVSGTLTSELDVGDEPAAPREDAVELRIRTVSGDVRVSRSAAAVR